MKTATKIKDLDDFRGDASLYRLSIPLSVDHWNEDSEEITKSYRYVIVSAAVAPFSGPETFIFGSNKKGQIVDWMELAGSFRGALDHAEALRGAGYDLV
jgi:hypothetical protein